MYLTKSEIVGSDKPVIINKTEDQFLYDQLVNLGENPADYMHVGFSTVYLDRTQLFEKVYQKGE